MVKLTILALKAFAALWTPITLCVSASALAKYNDSLKSIRGGDDFVSNNAVIAATVFTLLYLLASIAFLFLRLEFILASVMVDTMCLGFLSIFMLCAVASLSNDIRAFEVFCRVGAVCSRAKATIGLGWILWLLITATVIYQAIYVYRHFGGDLETWRTPLHTLLDYGSAMASTGRGISATGGLGSPYPGGSAPASFPNASGRRTASSGHHQQQHMQAGTTKMETSAV